MDLFKITAAAFSSTAKSVLLSARGLGDETDDASAEPADDVFYPGPLGLLVIPVARRTLKALVARIGGPTEMLALGLWDKAITHAVAAVRGETRLFGAGWPAICVRLLDGAIELRVGTGGAVKLAPDGAGWANKNVARVDDTTANGTITFVCATAGPGVAITGTYTDANGVTTPLSGSLAIAGLVTGSGTMTIPVSGKITSGSSSVKA